MPVVAFRIGQSQAALNKFEPYAASILPGRCGVVGVATTEIDGLAVAVQRDVDETGFRGVDSVLECVFDQRNEEQGNYTADTI